MSNEHYDAGGIPVISILRAKLTQEQYEGYLLGNIIKYSLRLNFKDAKAQDAAKLAEYAKWLDESHWRPEETQRPGTPAVHLLRGMNIACAKPSNLIDRDMESCTRIRGAVTCLRCLETSEDLA